MYLPDTRARLSRKDMPTAHERPEIFDRGSRGRNKRESLVLVCGQEWDGCRHGHAFRHFATQAMPTGFEDEKAPLFGLSRACWDNDPAVPRICRDCQAKLDC